MADAQLSFITPTPELVELLTLQKNARRLLQEIGQQAFCKRKPDATPGCGVEIWFVKIKDGRTRALDDNLGTHKCREVKP